MGFWATVRDNLRPIPAPAASETAPPQRAPRGLAGQRLRVSQDTATSLVQASLAMAAPLSPLDQWRQRDLDSDSLDRIAPAQLLELLVDVSPDVSRALWDFLRLCNPGYEATVLRPSGAPAAAPAQATLKAVLSTLQARSGDLNITINRLFIGGFLRGAFMAELVLDQEGHVTLDLATPDPATATFHRVPDPDVGTRWQLGQVQRGQWVALDRPTIAYVPIDPLPGSPYGRSLATPAIFPTLFALAMLHDVRRVVQQQGYPRYDLVVSLEKLASAMPADAEPGSETYQAWIDDTIAAVSNLYAGLEPDDAFVHTDAVEVKKAIGAVDASSLGAIATLIAVLERQAIRALKSMPLLMGAVDGASEANAVRQWEIFAAGIKSLQHLCENLLERLLTLALEAQGVAGTVRFRFAELRAAELLRDAQVDQLRGANASAAYAAGWISQDEAAQRGAGKDKADQSVPRSMAVAAVAPSASTVNPEPGAKH